MTNGVKINSVYDFSEKGLVELKNWLEPWWRQRKVAATTGELPGRSLEEAYLDPGLNLLGWWRLGEDPSWPTGAIDTPSFMLDSSGNGNHLHALNKDNSGAVWFPTPGDAHLPITNVPGALTTGDPAINDGGVRFNYNQYQWTVWGFNLVLQAPISLAEKTWVDDPVQMGHSWSCWLKFLPYNWPGVINDVAPGTPTSPGAKRPILGDFTHSFGIGSWGTEVEFGINDGKLTFLFMDSSGTSSYGFTTSAGFAPDQWFFLTVTVGRTGAVGSATYTRRILVNCVEIATVTGLPAAVGLTNPGTGLTLGGAYDDDLRFGHGACCIDEFAVFGHCLTDAEMLVQMNATVQNIGDTWVEAPTVVAGPAGTNGGIVSGAAPAGFLVAADGSGGTLWAPPVLSGPTSSRPTATIVGESFYDTTLVKPIWWDGSVWKDAAGTTV